MPAFNESADLRRNQRDEPNIVLFVSHRWRSPQHPDPDGRSLAALRRLIGSVDLLARGLDPQCATPAPDLRQPGMLQATVVVWRLLATVFDGRETLDHIAVFYDYACLPQGSTAEELARRRAGLAVFPDMLHDRRVALVALRADDDAYDTRAWCLAETLLSLRYESDRPWADTFPIRVDLGAPPPSPTYPALREALNVWVLDTAGALEIDVRQFEAWVEIARLCLDWFSGAREEATGLLHHTGVGADVSFLLHIRAINRLDQLGGEVELARLLPDIATELGVVSSKADDLVPATLMILAALRWEQLSRSGVAARSTPDVWRDALTRHLTGRSTRVVVRRSERPGQPTLSFTRS